MSVQISGVEAGSIAEKHGIKPGSMLLKINGHEINDVLDYRFFIVDEELIVLFKDEKFKMTKIVKDEYADIGLEFETYLMDKQHSCQNKCIFCFVDQLPEGMRDSLYFKDDDSRMCFLFGNYITLTNLKQKDIDRIIEMHISPINISVHTMNPELREKMMRNRRAGESLKYIEQLAKNNITMNTQLVLCPGINDGKELEFSIRGLKKFYPAVQSVACVPVGLTDHRENLTELKPYTKITAGETIDVIENLQREFRLEIGKSFCYAADEFYLKAEREIPTEEMYDGYPQLENGVGLLRLLEMEVEEALKGYEYNENSEGVWEKRYKEYEGQSDQIDLPEISIATGYAAENFIKRLCCKVKDLVTVHIYPIENTFFGQNITVTGLLTGYDIIKQLKGKPLGKALLLTEEMFKADEDILLDDVSIADLEKELNVKVVKVPSGGYSFVEKIMEVR
ncbi:MAG: DUF512 domain-containing protein [Ruminococcaceae bacterium]|nr:DUF512 domain-containing protein [Oscillospiraceae bacterium]